MNAEKLRDRLEGPPDLALKIGTVIDYLEMRMAEPALSRELIHRAGLLRRFDPRRVIRPRIVFFRAVCGSDQVNHAVIPVAHFYLGETLSPEHGPELLMGHEGLDIHNPPVEEDYLL